ncbi:MAG TPA: hypothetical protein VLB69_08550, partial [Rudaea sp.]|nr:hypothetical protein [Rudaea sp.]
ALPIYAWQKTVWRPENNLAPSFPRLSTAELVIHPEPCNARKSKMGSGLRLRRPRMTKFIFGTGH